MDLTDCDIVIVGAGFFGATLAERIASLGKRVVVIDRRMHIGGNAYSEIDSLTGIEVHKYGAHVFHTSNEDVWTYLHRFSTFTDYRHRVFTSYRDQVYSLPINLGTICQFFGRRFTPLQARDLIASQASELGDIEPQNLEDVGISSFGRPLYEAFVRGYTLKQWGKDPRDLPASILRRLPVRYNFDDRYFSDKFEGLPMDGYSAIFQKMLRSPRISVQLGVDFFDVKASIPAGLPVIYSGPIDRYFDYAEGKLGWRTLDLEWEVVDEADYQGTPVINFADENVPFTRIVEFRHFRPERVSRENRSIIVREFPRFANGNDEPYYPIGAVSDRAIHLRYKERANVETNVHFGGRLGSYRYWDMHQAIGAALKRFDTIFVPYFASEPGRSSIGRSAR